MQKQETLIFKEEILKIIRDFKETLMKNIDSKITELNDKNIDIEEKMNYISKENQKLIEKITNNNLSIEKVKVLETFKNKVDSMLITHEIRINNNMEEISSVRTRYDRALIENLLVPGYIGPSCQYKNIGEFIVYNIGELSKIKSERETFKSNIKEIKTKTDSVMKTILNLTESLVKRCNDYTNAQISEIKKMIYEKMMNIDSKEREMKEIIKNYQDEKKNININDKFEQFKEEFSTSINTKIDDIKKTQEESLFKEINKNNSFLENYTKNIIQTQIKDIKKEIKELQNKIVKNNISLYKKNDIPMVSSYIQKSVEEPINNNSILNIRRNTNESIENYIPNKTFTNMKGMNLNRNIVRKILEKRNNEIQKNNNERSLEDILIEEIEKDKKKKKEEKEIPDIVLKHKESKLLLNYNQNQKLKKFNNNLHEIKSGKNFGKKYNILNINTPVKKGNTSRDSSKINLNNKKELNEIDDENKNINNNNNGDINQNEKLDNNNIVYNNTNNKNLESQENIIIDNNISEVNLVNNSKNHISLKKHLITDDNIQNFSNIKCNKNIDKTNKENKVKYVDKNNNVPIRNIIEELKIPRILDKRILSNDELEEMKINSEKMRNLNNKVNFKIDLNKSGTISFKLMKKNGVYFSPNHNHVINDIRNLKSRQKNLMSTKSDRNIKFKKERNNKNDYYNLVNLELGNKNYTVNGATVLAQKKLVNNHITKIEGQNSLSKLFNVQLSKNNFQNNENQ